MQPSNGLTGAVCPPDHGFVSTSPGETWEEGLLCGNGTIGASVLGCPLDEIIVFSHEDIWLPNEVAPRPPSETASGILQMRRLAEEGRFEAARQKGFEVSGSNAHVYPDKFVTAFDLRILSDARGEPRDYYRSLDFSTGVATVGWRDDCGHWNRRFFVSRADGSGVLHFAAPAGKAIDCTIRLAPRQPSPKERPGQYESGRLYLETNEGRFRTTAEKEWLTFTHTFAAPYPGSVQRVEGVARVFAPGAVTRVVADALEISGAEEVLVLIIPAPMLDSDLLALEDLKDALSRLPTDYDHLLARHTAVHSGLFNRLRLNLGGDGRAGQTSEELLGGSNADLPSETLLETVFDAGRYNIISSCGKLPPTLQGVWAGNYSPFWSGGYTNDGNLPAAVAGLLRWNTPELMQSYTGYIESLLPHFRVNAKNRFGCRGLQVPVSTANCGYNLLPLGWGGGFWAAGAAWAAHFFYDYYLYTEDESFLAEHAMPFMEEALLFFEDFLYEGPDGKLVFNPSYSPENTPGNSDGGPVAINATMDVMAVKELITNLIAGSRILRINSKKIPNWRKMLGKLPDYMLTPQGVVKEWCCNQLDEEPDHRHSSHLYELFDGMPASIEKDPALREGFRRIVEQKLTHHYKDSFFMAFGIVQLGQAAAALGQSELAYNCVTKLVHNYWLSNFASMHNANKQHQGWALNMDISGGLPAIMLMMLLDSRPGLIKLLPALPDQWPVGTLEGALCRGGIEVRKLHWEPGRVSAVLSSRKEQTVTLKVPRRIGAASVDGNPIRDVYSDDGTWCTIALLSDTSVTVEFECRQCTAQ